MFSRCKRTVRERDANNPNVWHEIIKPVDPDMQTWQLFRSGFGTTAEGEHLRPGPDVPVELLGNWIAVPRPLVRARRSRRGGMATTLDDAAEAVSAALLEVLPHRGAGDDRLTEFVEDLGWTLPQIPPVLRELDGEALGAAVARLAGARRRQAGDEEITRTAIEVTTALATFAAALDELPARLRTELPAPLVAATKIDTQFRSRLLDHGVCRYLEQRSRHVVEITRALGIVVIEERPARQEAFQPPGFPTLRRNSPSRQGAAIA